MNKLILFFSIMTIATISHAAGAEEYKTLKEVKAAKLYNLTCSNTKRRTQLHVSLSVNKGIVDSVNILGVTPAKSVSQKEFSPTQLAGLKYSVGEKAIGVTGQIDGGYYGQTFELSLTDSRGGLVAQFFWDDGDGARVETKLDCGAINYVIGIN